MISTAQSQPRPACTETLCARQSVRGLVPLLDPLPPLSDHPHRDLQTRDGFVAHLRAFFKATLRSRRSIDDFRPTRPARRNLTVARLPKSTLAEFPRLVDPSVLEPIVAQWLPETARRGLSAPADLPASIRQVLAVDGTVRPLAAEGALPGRSDTPPTRARPRSASGGTSPGTWPAGCPAWSTSTVPAPASPLRPPSRSRQEPSLGTTGAASPSR